MVDVIHAGAPQAAVVEEKPQGSMMSSGTPRQAASRMIAPVFCGMSGW